MFLSLSKKSIKNNLKIRQMTHSCHRRDFCLHWAPWLLGSWFHLGSYLHIKLGEPRHTFRGLNMTDLAHAGATGCH